MHTTQRKETNPTELRFNEIMEDESSYISSLIAKLYENTAGRQTEKSDIDEGFIKQENDDNDYDDDNQPITKKRKVVDEEEEFFKNSSAAIIAESTEKTLKQMNIDPHSKEGKIQRRKIRNRMSAQIHRDRKKAYIDYLEDKVRKRDEVITILQKLLKKNQRDNYLLRNNLSQHNSTKYQKGSGTNHDDDDIDTLSASGVTAEDAHLHAKTVSMPLPMTSPALSATSTESVAFTHPEGSMSGTSSQGSSSPELEHDYFPDFDINMDDGAIDSKFFSVDNEDNELWLPQQYQDLAVDLDADHSLGEDDILKFPLQGGNTGEGGSFSMFSLVMMMSFSFFTGIVSMGTVGGAGAGTGGAMSLFDLNAFDSSSIMQPWTLNPSSFVTDTVQRQHADGGGEYSYGLLSASGSVATGGAGGLTEERNHNEDADIDTDRTTSVSPVGGGRVLLSISPPNEDQDDESSHDSSYHFPSRRHSSQSPPTTFDMGINSRKVMINSQASASASLSSLWRQQNYNFIGTIYPPRDGRAEMNTHENSTDIVANRKYLRFRSVTDAGRSANPNSSATSPLNTIVPAADKGGSSLQASDKSVTLYQKEHAKPDAAGRHDASSASSPSDGSSHSHEASASPLSSKILLSEGRVLLNPLLADMRTLDTSKSSSVSSQIIPAMSSRSDQSSPRGEDSSRAAGKRDRGVGNGEEGSKLLTMMIPATSIQWGFEWIDESSPDNSEMVMKHLLKNFNLTTYDHEEDVRAAHPSTSVDMSKLWLEIGCNVLDAKLVQNIL